MILFDSDSSTPVWEAWLIYLWVVCVIAGILYVWNGGRFTGLGRALGRTLGALVVVGLCAGALFLLVRFIHWAWTF